MLEKQLSEAWIQEGLGPDRQFTMQDIQILCGSRAPVQMSRQGGILGSQSTSASLCSVPGWANQKVDQQGLSPCGRTGWLVASTRTHQEVHSLPHGSTLLQLGSISTLQRPRLLVCP